MIALCSHRTHGEKRQYVRHNETLWWLSIISTIVKVAELLDFVFQSALIGQASNRPHFSVKSFHMMSVIHPVQYESRAKLGDLEVYHQQNMSFVRRGIVHSTCSGPLTLALGRFQIEFVKKL